MPQRQGAKPKTSVRFARRICHENRFIPESMMGVDTPIPPVVMNARRPKRAPRGGFRTVKERWEIEPSCPAVPREKPSCGEPSYLQFSCLWYELTMFIPILHSTFFKYRWDFCTARGPGGLTSRVPCFEQLHIVGDPWACRTAPGSSCGMERTFRKKE